MKTSTILTFVWSAVLPAAVAWAQHDHSKHGQTQQRQSGHATEQQSAGDAVDGKVCPVSGKPARAGATASVRGQEVQFCCGECIGIYNAEPDKYAPAVYRQIHPQRVQVKCPVMGGKVNPEVFIEHKGERIQFCCRGCDGRFQSDPAKSAAGLKSAYTEQVHCPVTGKPIDPRHSVKAAGREVYFCSSGCTDRFQSDPQKYAVAALPASGLLAHGATAGDDLVRCPVCPPEQVHKRSEVKAIAHEGKAYFLSSDKCARQFQASPAKYLQGAAERPKTPRGCGCCSH